MEHKRMYDRNYKCAFIKFHMWTCCNVADTYDAACHKRDHLFQGRTQGGGGCRAAGPPSPQNRNKKKDFIDTMVSKVLRDLLFSRNQPLKSADD
jgi:hypothetical protein